MKFFEQLLRIKKKKKNSKYPVKSFILVVFFPAF